MSNVNPRVVVTVAGGLVTETVVNRKEIEVLIVDYDNDPPTGRLDPASADAQRVKEMFSAFDTRETVKVRLMDDPIGEGQIWAADFSGTSVEDKMKSLFGDEPIVPLPWTAKANRERMVEELEKRNSRYRFVIEA
jgi:hypothetical protein